MAALSGIRVLEIAMWGFVPSAGVVLADWGADVIKVEHPIHGDPMRGLVTSGAQHEDLSVNFMWEINNRGKRSITIDLRSDAGREVVAELVGQCDVFLTSFLPSARRKLGIDETDIRTLNPRVIYARGSGSGPDGPESERGGYDMAAYWSRSGIAHNITPDEVSYPLPMPAAGFGDVTSGALLAGGIGTALFQRERTGVGCTVDLSLLASGMWSMSTEITGASVLGTRAFFRPRRESTPNPIVTSYRTKDDRFVQLIMLEADLHWPDLCRRIGRPDLVDDERYATAAQRAGNSVACMTELQRTFEQRTLTEWSEVLADATGVWAVVAEPTEVPDDPQSVANHYVVEGTDLHGATYPLVRSPLRFDRALAETRPAPEHGQHTEEVLLEAGWDWDGIGELRDHNVV